MLRNSLEALFGKNMVRACKILDEGGVRRVTGAPSGRSLFLVSSPISRFLLFFFVSQPKVSE